MHLKEFLSNLLGKELRVVFSLIWVLRVLYSVKLLLVLLDELDHEILSLHLSKVADLQLVNLLNELQGCRPLVVIYLKAAFDEVVQDLVGLLLVIVQIVQVKVSNVGLGLLG